MLSHHQLHEERDRSVRRASREVDRETASKIIGTQCQRETVEDHHTVGRQADFEGSHVVVRYHLLLSRRQVAVIEIAQACGIVLAPADVHLRRLRMDERSTREERQRDQHCKSADTAQPPEPTRRNGLCTFHNLFSSRTKTWCGRNHFLISTPTIGAVMTGSSAAGGVPTMTTS